MSAPPVESIELAVSGLAPNEQYIIAVETTDDDALIVRVERFSKEFKKWLPVKVHFEENEHVGSTH